MALRRLAAVGLALVALLVVVALASRGPRPLGVGGGEPHVSPLFFDYAFTTLVIVLLGVLVAAVMVIARLRQERPPRERAWWAGVAALCVAVLVLVVLVQADVIREPLRAFVTSGEDQPFRLDPDAAATRDSRDVELRWAEFAVFGGVLLALLAAVALHRRLNRPGPRSFRGLLDPAADLSAVLDDAIDDLRSEQDVRRAVIAAYARMEKSLASHGLARRKSEAPLEYLQRTLVRLQASAAAVTRLTDLFEWAKFSQHEVDESMRDEAVDALVAMRDELRAA